MKKNKRIVNLLPLDPRRFKVTYLFSLVLIFGLFGRLVNLQIFSASDLQKKAVSDKLFSAAIFSLCSLLS